VGVAMGKKGAEVAKESSEMVLADDNFASIAHAVEEGRGIYDNLKKAIIFILPTSVGEALTIVAAIVMGEIFYVFNSRYLYHSVLNQHGLFGNRLVWLAIITLIAFQMALTYWQPMQVLFGSVAIEYSGPQKPDNNLRWCLSERNRKGRRE